MDTPRVALLGQYGIGNLGNEGSMDAFVSLMGQVRSGRAPIAVAENPDVAERSHQGLTAMPIAGALPNRAARAPGQLRRVLQKLVDVVHGFRIARHWDVLVVAGSGTFEKLGVRPGGLPFDMLRLALVSRLRGKQFVLFGIGAEPNDVWLNRLLLRATFRLASYVSVRDDFSRRSLVDMGAPAERSTVHPDLVFALPMDIPTGRDPGLVVVGVIAYFGMKDVREDGVTTYQIYVHKLTDFVAWLVAHDFRVRLVTGDHVDFPVAQEIERSVRARSRTTTAAISAVDVDDLYQLGQETAGAAVVVASRFHNVLVAIRTGTPTISLSYGPKNDVVLERAGLHGYAQAIETFDVEVLKAQFTRMYDARIAMSEEIGRRTSGYEAAVEAAFEDMWATIGGRR